MNYSDVVVEIRARLTEYLSYLGIDWTKKFSCLHPEHEDKNPSAGIVPGTNLCKCFSCGRTYNVFDIALYIDNMPDKGDGFITKTIPYLINVLDLQIDLNNINGIDIAFFKEKKKFTDMFGMLADIASNELATNPSDSVRKELTKREWDDDLISLFCLGQSFDIMEKLGELEERGITRYTLEQCGIINGTKSIIMNNADSIVFPLLSPNSSVVGLAVRTGQKGLKYINTQNNHVFNKSEYLYGIHLYDNTVDTAVLVEGYSDVITLTGVGVKNVFAYCSSNFSAKQIESLYTTNINSIIFFTDNDAASINGVINSVVKNYDALLPYNIYIKASAEGDPDDYVRTHGYDGYLALKKLDFFTFYIKFMLKNNVDSETLCNNVLDMLIQHTSELSVEKRLGAIYGAFDGIFTPNAIKAEYINRRHGINAVSKNKVDRMKNAFVNELKKEQDPDAVIEKVSSFYSKLSDMSSSSSVNISPLSLIERINAQEEIELSRVGDVEAYKFNMFPQLQEAIDGSWERSGLLAFGGVPNTGKCQRFDSEVLLSDGSILTIEEVVKNKITNGIMMQGHKLVPCEFSDWIDSGELECFNIKTKSGLETNPSETHPYYTPDGWKQVKELKVGDKIAIAARYPEFKESGDLDHINMSELVEELCASNCSDVKRIPNRLRRCNNDVIREFINEFISHVGWQTNDNAKTIKILHSNRKLLVDMRHLFLRFGVRSTVSWTKDGDKYSLVLNDVEDAIRYLNKIILKPSSLTDDNIDEDIYFDEIVEISSTGKHRCYDLTVLGEHNFICNDTVVHNTSLFCNLALDLSMSNTDATTKDVVSVIHSIDDEADIIVSKLVSIIVANKYGPVKINAFRHPNYYRKEIEDLDKLRAYGYSVVKNLISSGKLLILDSKHGKSIKQIRDIMEHIHNTTDKQPIYFLDNFHKIKSITSERRAETEQNSNSLQEYSQLYSIPIFTTVEYRKFEKPREPNNSDIKETGAVEYDVKLVAHLHNDIHTFGDDAKLYTIDDERNVLLPLVKFIVGKNKLNSFKGNLYFVFDPEVGTYREATKKEIQQSAQNEPYKVAKDSLVYENMYVENASIIGGMVETL